MKRGQAFETMMLVISVIVAVAILGILLGFLGGIGTFGANANTVMPDLVKKVSNTGYGVQVKDNVEFSVGDKFYPRTAIGEAPVSEDKIQFDCASDAAICNGENAPITIDANKKLTVNSKISGSIAVCTSNGVDYFIIIGDKGKDGVKKTSSTAEDSSHCKLG